MKLLGCVGLFLLFLSCGTIQVNYDYDKETDFSAYTTYHYFSDMETGLSELDTKRLLHALDVALKAKGLRFSEEPDFFIDIKSTTFQKANNSAVGVGVGGSGRGIGGGVSIGIPVGHKDAERRIQLDFVDSQKNTLFWQAVSESSFNEQVTPSERERDLGIIVEKMMSKYPPK